MIVKTEKELVERVKRSVSEIEVSKELYEDISKIFQTDTSTWRKAFTALKIATLTLQVTLLPIPSLLLRAQISTVIASGLASSVTSMLGHSATVTAILVTLSSGQRDLLDKLRKEYQITSVHQHTFILKKNKPATNKRYGKRNL